MNTFNYNANAASISMMAKGKRHAHQLQVDFGNGNDVYFECKQGNVYSLRWVRTSYETNYVYRSGRKVDTLTYDENTLIVAAMMIMGISVLHIGLNEVIVLGAPNVHVVVEEPAPKRHATTWDRAQEFGISGHAKQNQQQQQRRPQEEPRRQVPVKPLGKWGWAAVIAVATVAVVAAATADNN